MHGFRHQEGGGGGCSSKSAGCCKLILVTCQRVGSYGDLAERWTYRTGRWPLTCQTLAAHYRSLIAFHFNCWPTGGNKVSSASLGADVLLSSCSTVFQRMTMDPPASTFQQKVANHFTLRPFIQKTSSTLTASNFIGKTLLFLRPNCIT